MALLIVLSLWAVVGGNSPAFAAADATGITPELRLRLLSAAPGEFVPFTLVLREQADARRLRITADRLALTEGRAAARAHATASLKEVASRTQTALLSLLEAERLAGRVREYRSLWIANVIVGAATAEVIGALAERPEVERVTWDPPVSFDSQSDEIVPPEGRRQVPARRGPSGGPEDPSLVRLGDPPEDPEIGWNLEMIGAPIAWDAGLDGREVVVGVIDSGVDYTHSDLASHMWINEDEIPWNEEDDDFNGFVDDTLGWDFAGDTNDPMGSGPTDHGTRAAGLVAGDGTGGIITGVAPAARIMALKATGAGWSGVFAAIQYACDNGAHVISMSVSQKWHDGPKPDYAVWRQISDNELAIGVLHANSIGNEGDNMETDPIPLNISAPGCVPAAWVAPDQYLVGGISAINAVGAVDSTYLLAEYSSRGPFAWEDIAATWPEYPYEMPSEYWDYPYSDGSQGLLKPDILAPGRDVLSTMQGGGYLSFTGTSAACPHAAGVLAILLDADPQISPAQAAMALQLSALDLGPVGKDNDYGAGLVQIPAALEVVDSLDVFGYLTGRVADAISGDSLPGALVTVLETGDTDTSNVEGEYDLISLPGLYALEVSLFGYETDTLEVLLAPGETRNDEFLLIPWATGTVSGLVIDEETDLPIAGAVVEVANTPLAPDTTGLDGVYSFASFPADTPLVVRAIHFGHIWSDSLVTVADSGEVLVDFTLLHGVEDHFEVDQGWIIGDSTDTATQGIWVRCDPTGIVDQSVPVQPEDDNTEDPGTHCYLTGNGIPGSGEYQNDVDGGATTLRSPIFDGAWYYRPVLSFAFWYSNDTGLFVDDTLRIEVSNDAGRSWVVLLVTTHATHAWQTLPMFLDSMIDLTDSMCVRVIASDFGHASSVEVAFDDFVMSGPAYSDAGDQPRGWTLSFRGPQPNPFREGSNLTFVLEQATPVRLEIFDAEGRRVRVLARGEYAPGLHEIPWNATDEAGRRCAAGVYFSRFAAPGLEQTERLILIR